MPLALANGVPDSLGWLSYIQPLPTSQTKPFELMKEYKVEALIYYSKLTLDSEHIVKKSKQEIQEKLDEYARDGYKLTSTNATNFGAAVYIYLYFEKDI